MCWYSIIYTPPDRLAEAYGELKRVLMPEGYLLLAFQAGEGEPIHRADAQGTHLPLTSYRDKVQEVAGFLEDNGVQDLRHGSQVTPNWKARPDHPRIRCPPAAYLCSRRVTPLPNRRQGGWNLDPAMGRANF